MSFAVTAVVATSIGTSVYMADRQKKAAKKANKQAKMDATKSDLQMRRAEVFAETEGEGLGQLGQISLAIEEDEDIDNVLSV